MKLLRALVGAALVPPVLYMAYRITIAIVTGRGHQVEPLTMATRTFFFILPTTMVWLAATVVPLTRVFVQSGRATCGFMSLVGAACGLVTTLALYFWFMADRPFPPDTREIVNVLVIAPAIGALSSAAYWYLLDPPSYHAKSDPSCPAL